MANPNNSKDRSKLLIDLHVQYIQNLDKKDDTFEFWITEHLRVSGIYWAMGALDAMNKLEVFDKEKIIQQVISTQNKDGGFGGNTHHDSHMLYTTSAIQVLAIYDALDKILDIDNLNNNNHVNKLFISALMSVIAARQNPDGSFTGDNWGEIDTRFSYCCILSLSLLKRLDAINTKTAVDFIMSCQNFDGGFGTLPQSESHGGQIFCCVASLAILRKLDLVNADLLGWWLCERQTPSGGLCGRPEKKPDVCYSWWVLASLEMLQKTAWINKKKLIEFILDCQDEENGGIADRPGDMADVYHTFFGAAGLAFLGYPDLRRIDPAYAMPVDVLERMGLSWPRLDDYANENKN